MSVTTPLNPDDDQMANQPTMQATASELVASHLHLADFDHTATHSATSADLGRPSRQRKVPLHLTQDHQVFLPPSLLHAPPSSQPQRPMDIGGPPSIGGISRTSVRSSKSDIERRLAAQGSRMKLEELRRQADWERALAKFHALEKEIQISSDFRQAEIELETERLQHELAIVEQEEQNEIEKSSNLPGQDESVTDRTHAWVQRGVSDSDPKLLLPTCTIASMSQYTESVVSGPTYITAPVSVIATAPAAAPEPAIANVPATMPAAVPQSAIAIVPTPAIVTAPATPSATVPMGLQPAQPRMADPISSHIVHGAASTNKARFLPHAFNPNLPAFVPNTMLVQSSPTVRLYNDVPIAQIRTAGGKPATSGRSATQISPPRQETGGNGKSPNLPTTGPESSSDSEQAESSSSGDDDPSDNDKGNSHSCCAKGSAKTRDRSTIPSANASSSPGTVFSGPFGYGFGIWDSLPKLDIPKFDSEHDVRQYITFRSLWDSLMKGPMQHLPEATKFAYLRSHLGGRPLAIADRNLILGDAAYAATIKKFDKAYGDPGKIIQGLLDQLEARPVVAYNDWSGLRDFSDELATAIETAEKLDFHDELKHHRYATELVKKLPDRLHSEFLSKMWDKGRGTKYTVHHLNDWLKKKTGPAGLILLEKANKSKTPRDSSQWKTQGQKRVLGNQPKPSRSYLAKTSPQPSTPKSTKQPTDKVKDGMGTSASTPERITCLYCKVKESGHYLETCQKFQGLTRDQKLQWLKTNQRCQKCAKKHDKECPYPKKCKDCSGDHRTSLHELAEPVAKDQVLCTGVGPRPRVDYNRDVLIKVVPITVYGPAGTLDTFGVLDECAERSMILQSVVEDLNIPGQDEQLCITTVMGDTRWHGKCVNFEVSARGENERYSIQCAFTAPDVQLVDYSISAERLQAKWPHLRGLPLFSACRVLPSVLIGADHVQLTLSTEARSGPKSSSPVAVNTLFGWTVLGHQGLQIPSKTLAGNTVLFTSCNLQHPDDQLHQVMERFMAIDKLPHVNEKQATRSRLDKIAINTLEEETKEVDIDGITRLQTPLLWKPNHRRPSSLPQAVLALARSIQKKIEHNPEVAEYCHTYIKKLQDQGHVRILGPVDDLSADQQRGWYLPCHVVHSSGKYRLVFNCSFEYGGQNLNQELLAGPTLGPSLLGVLLRFRQGRVAVSGDITAMFHQVRLHPEERRVFRFLWKDEQLCKWVVIEWLVLPFGAACSPCCATFALQRVAKDRAETYPQVPNTIENETYVDNQLASRDTEKQATELVLSTRQCLQEAGFQMVKYASSEPATLQSLPEGARSTRQVQSLALGLKEGDPEPALGLCWDWKSDELFHPAKVPDNNVLTKRKALKVLASQFEPLGDLAPFTARAKLLVRDLWMQKLDWDERVTEPDMTQRWEEWCAELADIPQIRLPRCYTPVQVDTAGVDRSLHIFCDASEKLYGAVAYLRSVDNQGGVHLSFVLSKCRVAPKRLMSMPRLELMAALLGAQLCQVVLEALTVKIQYTLIWSDSTTVLSWIQSESCRFKVFVGTRISEIQTLTEGIEWRYVRTTDNPADDVTRGLPVSKLGEGSRWTEGPKWLLDSPEKWQRDNADVLAHTRAHSSEEQNEIKSVFCALTVPTPLVDVDFSAVGSWDELVSTVGKQRFTDEELLNGSLTPDQAREVETLLLQQAQSDTFKEEVTALSSNKEVARNSRLLQLSPELDPVDKLIRVGGRLRKAVNTDVISVEPHPVVLGPDHPITKLLIKEADAYFSHQAGTDQVFAHLRRRFWILRGRSAVKGILYSCPECRRWRAKPKVPRMGDLPKSRLRLGKPPFYSTGVDCFGPMNVKIGRRQEKRWGLLFKCMTTRAVHLDLLESLDADHFLMAYRRFAALRGVPFELLSDCGTNFKGANTEIEQALKAMEPEVVQRLAKYKVKFKFNPPNAPHFGGTWEREVRSAKGALKGVLENRTVTDAVLRTVLAEVEGILNSKPLGYASSEVADVDPVTPNMLLMGRRDPALPMVVYDENELKGRRSWRHSQVLADQFWRHFVRSYLPTLQTRQKWQREEENLSEGDVVMIAEPQLPRSQWPVGTVSHVFPSDDKRVRVVNVQVGNKEYKRPVARLVKLTRYDEDDAPGLTKVLLTQVPIPFRLCGVKN